MNHITIELCTEDRARLDKIIEALEKAKPRCENCVKLVKDICDVKNNGETANESEDVETPEQTQPENETPPQAKNEDDTEAPEVTVDDIRSKVLALTAAGKKEELKAIVKEYAPKVSEIPEDKLAEVLDKLNALEG